MGDDEATLIQAIICVELMNDRTNWQSVHMPNVGPYTPENQKQCLKCGKALSGVPIDEKCCARDDDGRILSRILG